MRDKNSHQVARTFNEFGIYQKHADRGYKVKNGAKDELGNADVKPGFPDGYFIGEFGGCFIETKNGEGKNNERFSFANWRPNQRRWYAENALLKRVPYYLFLMMGKYVHHEKYPRIALLIPAKNFLEIEAEVKDRKSLSYDYASGLRLYRLDWAGNDRWSIPPTHPFFVQFNLGEAAHERAS